MEFLSLSFSAIVLALYIFWFKHGFTFLRMVYLWTKIPGPSLWELLTIHAKGILGQNMAVYLWKMCASYEQKPWGMWSPNGYLIFVSDCESVSEVYKNKHMTDRAGMFIKEINQYTGEGLVTLNGKEHRLHRKLLGPAFRKNMLESQLTGINDLAANLVQQLRETDGESTDVRALIDDRTAEITVFTFTAGSIPYHQFLHLFPVLHDALYEVHLQSVNPLYYWLVHRMKKSTRKTEAAIKSAIANAERGHRRARNLLLNDLESRLDKTPSTPSEVLALASTTFGVDCGLKMSFSETMTILSTGHDTTAFTTNVSLLLLAQHKDVQQKMFEELESIFGCNDRFAQPDDLAKMVYVEMVIKEVLRLFPAAPMLARRVDKESNIGGVAVPEGSTLITHLLAIHRNPKFFEDPLKFDPERFSPKSSEGRHPFAYVPFGGGNRVCPGQVQAIMIVKTILCHVVRNFKILPGDKFNNVDDTIIAMYFSLRLTESSLRFVSRSAGPRN